jgi:aspartyl-tRNA(Asn)/glutamyl-tRNA(Gln) amidotransferase subunit C
VSLTREDVLKIADLARLALTEEELAHYGAQLSAVLDYAARLNEVDLSSLDAPELTGHRPDYRHNVMREDAVRPSLSTEDVLFNATATADGQFLIQPVLEES